MTENCIKTLKELRENNETFAGLSVEQLIFEAIRSVGPKEVKTVLEVTDWTKWMIKAHSLDMPPRDVDGIIEKYSERT